MKVVEIGIRVNRVHRLAYLPKILVESLGSELTIRPDSRAAVIYPTGEDPEVVMASLRIILQSMELSLKTSRRTEKGDRLQSPSVSSVPSAQEAQTPSRTEATEASQGTEDRQKGTPSKRCGRRF